MKVPPGVLSWLLEEENLAVRHRTLMQFLGRKPSDPDVQQAKAQLPSDRVVGKLLAKMHPDGYWLHRGQGADLRYAMSSSTHFVLAYLAELGMDRSFPAIARAAERYLNLGEDRVPGKYQACVDFHNIRTFVMLGYRDHPRVEQWINILLRVYRHDGGYLCIRPSFTDGTKSCIRGTIKGLTAFSVLPELWQSSRCRALVDYFLSRQVIYRKDGSEELVLGELAAIRFPFVIAGSLLEPILALSTMGYGRHAGMRDCWRTLEAKRDGHGRYTLDGAAPVVLKAEAAGAPSKWATFYGWLAKKHRDGVPADAAPAR
jgi:hypothetical protein